MNYAYPEDTYFGRSTFARIFIVSGEILYLTEIMYIPIDVELNTRGDAAYETTRWIWIVFIIIQMSYIWTASPILFAFYDTDEKKSYCRRLWDAIRIQLPLFITIALLILPTYFLANEIRVPANLSAYINETPNEEINGEMYYVTTNSIVHHA